ncbi:protein kinase domain-containing protein [Aspergillus clavatus NRRL 1]|uniref:Protein kinase domain protein n=1 Tax=Aspergillus clavatus (strain ATCC 1007 / CBS 513.65 / DSM 816 / NCTC 3887 / NRRL 1 / QM 1276 / 107) TaxID=344612 RepID=A1C781_ASPCL|nr:protein kinase domain protein [Aspergillus clavatus NRRL 1]EAW14252.1 protein kinase domain protein [Aspergillus clavatus NRRL 1]
MTLLYHLLKPFRLLLQCFRPRKQLQSRENVRFLPDSSKRPSPKVRIIRPEDDEHDSIAHCPSLPQESSLAASEISSIEAGEPYPVSSSALDELQTALSKARIEPHLTNGHVVYVPLSKLNELITEARVQEILSEGVMVGHSLVQKTARRIVQSSKRLFAILVSMKRGNQICRFLDEGITDAKLPFVLKPRAEREPPILQTSGGRDIMSISGWAEDEIIRLVKKQWRMLAPVFEQGAHYEFPRLQILPFMAPANAEDEQISGGWSVVYQACIHPAHHNIRNPVECQDREIVVAIKKLILPEPSCFNAERDMHTTLEKTAGAHSHLTNLLFTYKHGSEYHLVFPWADVDLRKYWETKHSMHPDARETLWSLKQMTGVAGALSLIHGFLRSNDSVPDPLFGHHGDIKAENILWFASSSGDDAPGGILRITDLGLASLHRMESASDIDPTKVTGTQTYSPPDKLRNARISRKWDNWSLGCLFLEFATSMTLGYEAVKEFGHLRAQEGFDPELPELSSDYFYTTDYEDVRPSVKRWVTRLVNDPRCSDMLYDLLSLVMRKMLRINPEDRATSQQIHQELTVMVDRASEDESYLVHATERPSTSW